MEVADPSTSGATPDAASPAANGTAEAATPGTEGTAKKVKKEKKVSKLHLNSRSRLCLSCLTIGLQ